MLLIFLEINKVLVRDGYDNFNDDSDIDIALALADYSDTAKGLSNLMRLRRKFHLRTEPHPVAEEDFRNNNPKYFVRTGIGLPRKTVDRRESSAFCQQAKVSKPNASECSRRSEMSVFSTGNPIPVNPNA
jgi:hypothetical protein